MYSTKQWFDDGLSLILAIDTKTIILKYLSNDEVFILSFTCKAIQKTWEGFKPSILDLIKPYPSNRAKYLALGTLKEGNYLKSIVKYSFSLSKECVIAHTVKNNYLILDQNWDCSDYDHHNRKIKFIDYFCRYRTLRELSLLKHDYGRGCLGNKDIKVLFRYLQFIERLLPVYSGKRTPLTLNDLSADLKKYMFKRAKSSEVINYLIDNRIIDMNLYGLNIDDIHPKLLKALKEYYSPPQ